MKWEMTCNPFTCIQMGKDLQRSLLPRHLGTVGFGKRSVDGILLAFKIKDFSMGPLGFPHWCLPVDLSDNLAAHSFMLTPGQERIFF